MRRRKLNVALTVAGSDSGGGAGIQGDLKTFAALGTHGVCAITAITAQNPRGVTAIQQCSVTVIQKQLEAVNAFRPGAAKTGMLFSAAIIECVSAFFRSHPHMPFVVDPVMIATSGAALLKRSAVVAMKRDLFPLASVITPNTMEAEVLTGLRLTLPEDLRTAARQLHETFGCAVLLKGGHLETGDVAIDLFWDGTTELLLQGRRARRLSTHGTGCTYAAAITALLACGSSLPDAVVAAKDVITNAIFDSVQAGPFTALNPGSQRQ